MRITMYRVMLRKPYPNPKSKLCLLKMPNECRQMQCDAMTIQDSRSKPTKTKHHANPAGYHCWNKQKPPPSLLKTAP